MQKIMFNDRFGLTDAVLKGRKTMTRRMEIPEKWHGIDVGYYGPDKDRRSILLYDVDEYPIEDPKTRERGQIMPKYKVGEVVAVAQCYRDIYDLLPDDLCHLRVSNGYLHESVGWTNKMFVLAHVMPHQIRITNVRVERLQDITDEDCLKEGIISKTLCPPGDITYYYVPGMPVRSKRDVFPTPRDAFATLIDKISGRGTWESNPWVFAYEFELVK